MLATGPWPWYIACYVQQDVRPPPYPQSDLPRTLSAFLVLSWFILFGASISSFVCVAIVSVVVFQLWKKAVDELGAFRRMKLGTSRPQPLPASSFMR